MSYQFAEINGANIHYQDVAAQKGAGTAVVFIHAGIVNLHMWDEQMDAFAQKYRVIRYDLRGWGLTERPSGEFSDVADLYELLCYLGVEEAAIVGCSFGGKTAIDFALTHPEMVSALVLVGAAVGGFEWQAADFGEKDEMMEAAYERGERELSAELETQIWFDGPGRTPDQVDQAARAKAYEMVLHLHQKPEPEGSKRIEVEPPAIERLAEIEGPTMVLVGEEDVADIRAIGELLALKLPWVEMKTMPDTAHLPSVERPSAFNKVVLDFLDRAPWRASVYGILPHETENKVWLVDDKLPQLKLVGGLWETEATNVRQSFQELLGDGIWPLYRTVFDEDEASRTTESAYVLENVGGAALVNGCWAGRDALTLLTDAQRTLVEEIWQERAAGKVPPERPPWLQPGWFIEAAEWIESQLAARGEPLTAPIALVKSWALSCVLKATTAQGIYYLKTVAAMPLFANEASVVKTLAQLYPQQVPTPLVSDVARDWMLLPALPELVGWGGPVAQRQAFLADFGQLQVAAVGDVDRLLAAGCLDRRLAQLPAQIEGLLTDEMVLGAAAEADRERLTALIPQLQAACAELASYGLPETLVHGDLHGGNAATAGEGFVYFDWTDACIAHPFFDMLNIFFEEDSVVRRQLRDSYLAQWTDFAPLDRLLAAWSLAELLGAVHHAVSYWQIMANIEPRSRYLLAWAPPFWLRKILELSEELYGS